MNNIENNFVLYQIALDMKSIGFSEPCLLQVQYSEGSDISGRKFKNSIWLCNGEPAEINGKKIKYRFPRHSKQGYGTLGIPTFSQVFKFFREKYNLYSTIALISNSYTERAYMVMIDYIHPHKAIMDFEEYETYEEAELECLKKLIEIVKQNNNE